MQQSRKKRSFTKFYGEIHRTSGFRTTISMPATVSPPALKNRPLLCGAVSSYRWTKN